MGQRLQFQTLLEALLGTRNVYFQAPPSTGMQYPCILYEVSNERASFADNSPYRLTTQYQVTYIDKNPDSEIPKKLAFLPMSSFSRRFTSDNLNHVVYSVHF